MSGSSEKTKLPQLYCVAVTANVGTFCLIASGMFLVLKICFYELPNSSNQSTLSQSEIDTLVLALYLIASSLSGEYIESVMAMTEDPKQFYSSVRLKTKGRERYYESKAACIQSLIFTTIACCVLWFVNQEIVLLASIAIILVSIVNVMCFGVIRYYKKFYT